ncbi:hypothetical protein RJ639_012965 [Escallonia herrerae]|uniref:Protein N-terminal asparagine amidohydrolase n=1 Tax=Escallonia herrerae TaxID=1293975 RepID=A0AA89ANH8_9ASTE|nr:hypothetical protein RJ639_012965 [Escallonia herrerae]
MIYVGGLPFSTGSSPPERTDMLGALMEHPILVSSSHSFRDIPEGKFSVREESSLERSTESRSVYVFQREYATVDPALVEFVGTDEATTCVGIVVRNRRSGMTSVAHLDSPKVVDIGITQMLSLVLDRNSDCILDVFSLHLYVHIVGAFEDASPQLGSSEIHVELDGYSLPLCTKIIETLEERGENFHIQTLHVLGHNTRWDSEGNAYPIFTGLLVETCTGSVNPARFDSTSRIPDEIVRRIRVCSSHEDPSWTGRLLETYDTQSDRFVVAPCCWTMRQFRIASILIELSDPEILLSCSTSPSAEGPNFVDSIRRKCEYLIQHPVWTDTFRSKQPRVFERTSGGGWTRRE